MTDSAESGTEAEAQQVTKEPAPVTSKPKQIDGLAGTSVPRLCALRSRTARGEDELPLHPVQTST